MFRVVISNASLGTSMLTCLGIVDNDDRRISVESIESSLHSRATASDMQTRCLRSQLLTFAIPTIPTEITPTRMFQLAAALGADADHCGHDGAFYRSEEHTSELQSRG